MDGNSWFGAWAPYNLKQNINPWDVVWNPSGQLGLVNVTMKSSDPPMERDIIENIASYGRQLGRINDAVSVLLQHMPIVPLTDDERSRIEGFQTMTAQIAALKETRGLPSEENITSLLNALAYMKAHDPDSFRRLTARVRTVVLEEGTHAG